ncbi:MAG: mechanosensitive ion channel family protein, partial [Burkholderiaceae bacterium]
MNTEAIWTFLSTQGADFGLKILAALAAWVVGRWIISLTVRVFTAALERGRRIDSTLSNYLRSILTVLLNIVLVLAILDIFGVKTTSFAALLAGAGLAIGTAWGGLLTHFAAGIFMQVLRPFKVGDFVQVGGVTGTVHEIGLFGTTVITPDNVQTIIGNNKIFSDTIQNYSALPVRRVDCAAKIA